LKSNDNDDLKKQIEWRCPAAAQFCDMSSFYDEQKTYANIFEDDIDGEYECLLMLQQDPVYIKRFIVKSTDEFLNLHHKQEGNEKANPKSLR